MPRTSTKKSSAKAESAAPDELMIVNDTPGEGCRIAVLQDGHLDELYEENIATATNVGNIYKGRVTNVESAIQAAFVDYGEGQNGFLHIQDLHPRYFPGDEQVERVGKKTPRRDRPLIQNALKRGDEVMVQVMREGIGTKGPTLTSYISIAGRLLVCMPYLDRVGVSRKLEDDLRREAKKTLDQIELPDGFGFILRTAGIGKSKTDLKRDVAYLMRLWKVMEKRIETVGAPCALYQESDLLIRTIRDILRPSIKAVIVDSESAYERINMFLQVIAPRSAPEVIRFHGNAPIFHAYDIERQIELIHSREVPLPSGGSIVIEQTEALVAIDVNSGKSRSSTNSEANAVKTNTEAVDEICRQLRLRDMGGLIVNDLIDMRMHRNRRAIEERIERNLKLDRAKTTALQISEFGLVQMTRQRMRPSVRKAHFMECPNCAGHGEIKSPESVAAAAVRHIRFLLNYDRVHRVEVLVSSRVASLMLSRRRRELVEIEEDTGKTVDVRVNDRIAVDRVDFYAYDERNADISVDRLPAMKIASLDELRKMAASAEAGDDADEEVSGGKRRRRRRRRRPGPADATAIALAGGFEPDEEEIIAESEESSEGAPKKKRRRRRRRRGRGDDASTPKDTATVTPNPDAPAERIYVLAKRLGVTSKEILERAASEDGFELKNHMSSAAGVQIGMIESWFAPEPTGEVATSNEAAVADEAAKSESGNEAESTDGEGAPRKKRRRRGRRGGRGRRRSGASAANTDADTASAEGTTESSEATPETDTESSAAETSSPRRSRSRKRPSKVKAPDNGTVAAGSGTEIKSASDDSVSDAAKTSSKKKTSRKKSGSKKTTKKSSRTSRKKTTTKAAADDKSSGSDDAGTVEVPATPKPRRSLYRSRRPATAASRETVEQTQGDSA
ncbi:MAG: Rne/Rng family ribonuclease [Planctomycetota bacterium]